MIGERGRVGRRARDAPTFQPTRVPEPGPRQRHQPDPALGGRAVEGLERHRRAGAAVMENQQRPVRVALVDSLERSAVGQREGERGGHPTNGTRP
jgi:hypothetical protein